MTTTIIAIAMALFLGAAIMVALYHCHRADNLQETNMSLQIKVNGYKDANMDPNAFYQVQRVCTDHPEFDKYNDCWGVCRRISKRGYIFCTTIKVFTDEDDEFNYREAVELCEILNAK